MLILKKKIKKLKKKTLSYCFKQSEKKVIIQKTKSCKKMQG